MNASKTRPGARFLPDFCSAPAIIEILVIAEVTAMILTMARGLLPGTNVLADFIGISLFMLWLALSSAAVLCLARRRLADASPRRAYLVCYALLLVTTLAISLLAVWLDARLRLGLVDSELAMEFLSRNLLISVIVSALALRYFHVQYSWKRQVEREADARIEALQARIRPHFLFNSLNTIAAMIGYRPQAAEQAVEDLSDLFRASLAEARKLVSVDAEIELAKLYVRLEALRLEERLVVHWDTSAMPDDVRMPRLTLQPLLENAIHHGIEPNPDGGEIVVTAECDERECRIVIRNPLAAEAPRRAGFHIALENTRERLQLALGNAARLETRELEGAFEARLVLPRGK
ncbi:MAG: histidine kinase [Gammaproteobacteria bacterium]|nr:histidine kinase [Gammaproteobacteria bacterium]